jgi:hypothetical protein
MWRNTPPPAWNRRVEQVLRDSSSREDSPQQSRWAASGSASSNLTQHAERVQQQQQAHRFA